MKKRFHWTQTKAGKEKLAAMKVARVQKGLEESIPVDSLETVEVHTTPTLSDAITRLRKRIDADTRLLEDLESLLSDLESFNL